MIFGRALTHLMDPRTKVVSIRRKSWSEDVFIKVGWTETAKFLYVESRNGLVPWTPNMIELCNTEDWEIQYDEKAVTKVEYDDIYEKQIH